MVDSYVNRITPMDERELEAWLAQVELCETDQALNQTREALYKRGQDPDDKIIAAIRMRRHDVRLRAARGLPFSWELSDTSDQQVDANDLRESKPTYWR